MEDLISHFYKEYYYCYGCDKNLLTCCLLFSGELLGDNEIYYLKAAGLMLFSVG